MMKSLVVDPIQVAITPPIVAEQAVEVTDMSEGSFNTNLPLGLGGNV